MRSVVYWILLSISGLAGGVALFGTVGSNWRVGLIFLALALFVLTALEAASGARYHNETPFRYSLALAVPIWVTGWILMSLFGLIILPGWLLVICAVLVALVVLAAVVSILTHLV